MRRNTWLTVLGLILFLITQIGGCGGRGGSSGSATNHPCAKGFVPCLYRHTGNIEYIFWERPNPQFGIDVAYVLISDSERFEIYFDMDYYGHKHEVMVAGYADDCWQNEIDTWAIWWDEQGWIMFEAEGRISLCNDTLQGTDMLTFVYVDVPTIIPDFTAYYEDWQEAR